MADDRDVWRGKEGWGDFGSEGGWSGHAGLGGAGGCFDQDGSRVGLLEVRLDLPGLRSLKEKRGGVKGLLERIRHRFQVSAAEVGALDQWQTAHLGFALVGNETAHVQSRLQKVVAFIEDNGPGHLVDYRLEMVT
ncbi:MAG: DUF503 domain-containing protein [Magnetococcales bacterium]|nr:DUF503 domain-containing protein [Magnetococcales bacterium]